MFGQRDVHVRGRRRRYRCVYPAIGVVVACCAAAAIGLGLTSGSGAVGSTQAELAAFQPSTVDVAPAVEVSRARLAAPVRVRVPSIGVNAALMRLGLKSDGTLQVPPNASLAGWFTGAPAPGELGPAIIAGHVHWNGQWGVFAKLAQLRLDDRIIVTRADGSRATFRVTRVSRFKKSHFPTNLVYGDINHVGLRLITCDGFDAVGHEYLDNLVVFAMLVSERPAAGGAVGRLLVLRS